MYTEEIILYYDTDSNGAINPADVVDEEHFSIMLEYCD
jgi:hypothetical protein